MPDLNVIEAIVEYLRDAYRGRWSRIAADGNWVVRPSRDGLWGVYHFASVMDGTCAVPVVECFKPRQCRRLIVNGSARRHLDQHNTPDPLAPWA
jgi:hypothetical protein